MSASRPVGMIWVSLSHALAMGLRWLRLFGGDLGYEFGTTGDASGDCWGTSFATFKHFLGNCLRRDSDACIVSFQ